MTLRRKISLLLAALALLTAMQGCKNSKPDAETQAPTVAEATQPPRKMREGIQTVLICCTEDYDLSEEPGGFRNENRVNFMMLMVIDERAGIITPVQINPDSRVTFSIPGKGEKTDMPIGAVCSYGSGGSDSSLNLLGAVSGLLGNVRIDHHMTFTMDAVSMVNDSIGGVSVPVSAYFGDLEEETVLLSGADAVAYFSTRDGADITNEDRMNRQHQYMRSLYTPFLQKAQDDEFLSDLLLRLGDNMATDLTLSQLILMFETFEQYAMAQEVTVVPGAVESAGFVVDADGLVAIMDRLIFE